MLFSHSLCWKRPPHQHCCMCCILAELRHQLRPFTHTEWPQNAPIWNICGVKPQPYYWGMLAASVVCELSSFERRRAEYISTHTKNQTRGRNTHAQIRCPVMAALEGFSAPVKKHEAVLLADHGNAGLVRCILLSEWKSGVGGRKGMALLKDLLHTCESKSKKLNMRTAWGEGVFSETLACQPLSHQSVATSEQWLLPQTCTGVSSS